MTISPWMRCLLVATMFLVTAAAQADFLFLKDGFVLQGRVLKEYQNITDPSGVQIAISKLGGFYLVDDGVRRTYFPTSLVASTENLDPKSNLEMVKFNPTNMQWHPSNSPLRSFGVKRIGEWQANGTRTLDVFAGSNVIQVDQTINTMTPHSIEVMTKRYSVTYSQFLTREFSEDAVLKMIRTRVKAEADSQKRELSFDDMVRVARFAAQAGWYEAALLELNEIARKFPSELPQLNAIKNNIKKNQTRLKMEELEDAINSGQHSYAQNLMSSIDQEAADTLDLTKLSSLRAKYKDQNAGLERLRKLLSQARQRANGASLVTQGGPILEEIDRDLNLDNATSLAVFLKMAEQEERFAARNQPAVLTPEQLLALRLTGWLQGSEAADQSKEAAEKLIRGRMFLQQFLITDNEAERKMMLSDYLAKAPLKADEVVQLIDQLPPPRAEPLGKTVLDLNTSSSRHWIDGVKYRVYLPPEYHHHRSYPLLLLIPNFGETYETTTTGWLEPAARKGFIVAVPEWVDGKQDRYLSSDKEQDAVLETLRDLRRRFRIDNNRVSLAGYSSGGSLVFDVALTRPHLFASASVVCGHAPDGIDKLRYNAQYLPFYIVDGSKNGFREKLGTGKKDALMTIFEYWIPKGYPSLLVEYQGRGFEGFPAEIPTIVDWMSRKKRSTAMPELGKADLTGNRLGQEFRIVRPSATRFYWMEADDHQATLKSPVLVSAGWEKEVPNSLRCVMTGMKRARVWLNASMVNFENPVEIYIQGPPGSTWASRFKKKLEPSLAVLLEDYYQRGDSKNLFTQYVDFTFSR